MTENVDKQKRILDLRKEIAKSIYKSPKTDEELKKEFKDASYEDLTATLKNMLVLKLIKREGFPAKYSISKEIAEKLDSRKSISESDKNLIKVSIMIESKGDNKATLEDAMNKIEERLKSDEKFLVYESKIAEIVVHDGLFSTYIEAEVSCKDLQSLFRLVYYYGVTSIDVIKPEKLNIPISDLQESLFTIVDMTHGYADMIFKLKQELNHITGKK